MTYQYCVNAFQKTSRLPAMGGYVLLYHAGETNHCPACGGKHWAIGRVSAECVRCETALPLAHISEQPMQPLFYSRLSKTA